VDWSVYASVSEEHTISIFKAEVTMPTNQGKYINIHHFIMFPESKLRIVMKLTNIRFVRTVALLLAVACVWQFRTATNEMTNIKYIIK
jgi:hypothetical protein